MRKALAVLSVVAAMVFAGALTGCSGDDDTGNGNGDAETPSTNGE